MFKKLVLIVCTFFVSVQAQDQNDIEQEVSNLAFQELVYDMGMSLVEQDTICNVTTARKAVINLYEDVDQVAQVATMFLMIDEEMVEQKITTIEELIDYELIEHRDLATACIIWLAAFQDVFTIFTQLHPQDVSFDAWIADIEYFGSLEDESQLQDPGYKMLLQACSYMVEAQMDMEYEFKALA